MKRRRFLQSVVAGTATGLAGCSQSTTPADQATNATGTASTANGTTSTTGGGGLPGEVGLETLASGLGAPTDVAFAPEADRRYVAEQNGRLSVHGSDGLRDAPFLDLRDTVEVGSEKGLLGVALHPDFAENRRLFVRYSAPRRQGTPSSYSHTFVLAEFEATADGRRVRRDSERTVLEIPEPQANHNAGSVLFGPDGYLYVGVGDGGAGGDQGAGHVQDWYDAVDGGNGQDVTENLLGSVLRIDVDSRDGDRPYGIPDDNPLVGGPGRDEQYAWGLRNPWRMSFDGADFFVADVGQRRYEEVNLVEKGGNYGWNVREGAHCYQAENCPDATPKSVRGGEPLVDPVVEYAHSGDPGGVSVIGGHVYRGSTLPGLRGAYVFGDLRAKGRLFVATRSENRPWPIRVVEVAGDGLDRILSFGRDDAGELYVLRTAGGDGRLHRVVPAG
ncbi:PQQ-dependent sugar dehydrogenase [Halomicrococcus sp. NG-SE-24]|uniref:PQQ-dependent sugar dehydrogenase n=1 Tax=Halomicrococcus sp. NG-SE-24 TaxID=3436928 RepID=UPI003D999A91